MKKRGKNYTDSMKLIDRNKLYAPSEAIELVQQTSKAKFDETIDLAVRLGVDPRHADQQVRGSVVLPHGTGKTSRVLVIAKGEKVKEAEDAGADFVGGPEMVERIQKDGWMDFDVVVATPDMMGVVGKIGRILGPKGLMPNPKSGTVTFEIEKVVNEIKAGKIEYRVDKSSNVHVPIGKASFGSEKLLENYNTIIDALNKAKPAAAKGNYMRTVTISSTMGPRIKLNSGR